MGAFFIAGLLGSLLPLGGPKKVLCPHWISPAPGRLAFSFVLAQDVLHERYGRGDENYYRLRNQRALASLPPTPSLPLTVEQYPAIDNLAVGFERLHQTERGIPWLRAKLESQQRANLPLSQKYTTLANLGTLLIHQHMGGLMKGDPRAESGVREGLQFVELSIKANPDAHFGREVWQAQAVRTLLRIHSDPSLRLKIDILARPWMQGPARPKVACNDIEEWGHLASTMLGRDQSTLDSAERKRARQLIPKDGAEPFDEPALGLLGMWWFGGGPNPHLALALAGIFERVGELDLAWVAYQRALELQEKFWPDPAIRQKFLQHCGERQSAIELALGRSHTQLDTQFRERLKAGLAYQSAHNNPDQPDLEPRPPVGSDFLAVGWQWSWVWQFLSFGLLGAGLSRRLTP